MVTYSDRREALRAQVETSRQTELYNQAVDKARRHDRAGAVEILDRLLAADTAPEVARAARSLRDKLGPAPPARKR